MECIHSQDNRLGHIDFLGIMAMCSHEFPSRKKQVDRVIMRLIIQGTMSWVLLSSEVLFGQRPYIIETMHSYTLPM